MARNARHIPGLDPEAVFDVLRDGHSYGHWVFGTRKIRAVDQHWPRPGTCIHYTIGYGPLRKEDRTEVIAYRPEEHLELEARAWPAGTISIVITARPEAEGTTVSIEEAPKAGLARTLHNPLLDLAIKVRNIETLRRLENRARQRAATPR